MENLNLEINFTGKESSINYFTNVIKAKFSFILNGKPYQISKKEQINFSKKERAILKEISPNLGEFISENIILNKEDFKKLKSDISDEIIDKIISILRSGTESETNPKILKYIGDNGVLKDEKNSFYMNRFAEYILNPEEFYNLIPQDIKEYTIEKFHRFIEKQDTYSFKGINNLDKYYRFLGEKINFPKVGIKLLLEYYKNIGFITTNFNDIENSYKIELTEKGKNGYLGMKELLEIKGESEYSELTGDLKKKVTEMILSNLQEGKHDTDPIRDELLEEGILVRKKDLLELRRELFQLMASKSNSKSIIEQLNDEFEETKNYEVVGGIYQFKRKEIDSISGDKIEKTYSIPVSEVDNIFKSYSKYGKNATQQNIMYEFKISKEVWSLLKSRLSLTKDSLPVSPHSLESFEGNIDGLQKFSDNLGDELIRDKFRKAIMDSQEKEKNKEFDRMKKVLSNIDNFLEHLETYIHGYESKDFGFQKEIIIDLKNIKTDEYLSMSFGDIHLGKMNSNEVINRIKRMTKLAVNYPQKNICLIGLGDWFEAIVEGGMHPGQIETMDGPFGFDLIMLFVNLIEEMIITLSKSGKEITFYSVGGNHDRLGKSHSDDAKRTANLIVMELIKKGLQNMDVKIEAFRERTNTFEFGNFHYIINHGEDGFSKKVKTRPEEVLWEYGNQKKHNIIKFGHEHHGYLGETKDATIIGTSHLAGAGEYDTRLGLFSETGVTIIEENEDNLPDVSFKRIR